MPSKVCFPYQSRLTPYISPVLAYVGICPIECELGCTSTPYSVPEIANRRGDTDTNQKEHPEFPFPLHPTIESPRHLQFSNQVKYFFFPCSNPTFLFKSTEYGVVRSMYYVRMVYVTRSLAVLYVQGGKRYHHDPQNARCILRTSLRSTYLRTIPSATGYLYLESEWHRDSSCTRGLF